MLKSILSLIVIILLLQCGNTIEAKKLPGYIITNNQDTIEGTIKMYLFDRLTGNLTFNGVNLDLFYYEVAFKLEKQKRFQIYKPDEISGYAFNYKNIEYVFHSFTMNYKSIVKSERQKHRFLRLLYKNDLSLYCNQVMVWNSMNPITPGLQFKPVSYSYRDYYIYNSELGLQVVKNGTLSDYVVFNKEHENVLKQYLSFLNSNNMITY